MSAVSSSQIAHQTAHRQSGRISRGANTALVADAHDE